MALMPSRLASAFIIGPFLGAIALVLFALVIYPGPNLLASGLRLWLLVIPASLSILLAILFCRYFLREYAALASRRFLDNDR
jgi:ABC-type nickel/cobalt efflux system permease component RcnA